MSTSDRSITLPAADQAWSNYLVAIMQALLSAGLLWCGFAVALPDRDWPGLVFSAILAVLCVAIGVASILVTFRQIHMSSDGIWMTNRGRVLWRLPSDEIRLLAFVGYYSGNNRVYLLALSRLDGFQLAQLREAQLAKHALTRGELPFRKRAPGWEQSFQREYLMYCARRRLRAGRRGNIHWLHAAPEVEAAVLAMFPNVEVVDYRPKEYEQVLPQETPAGPFARGRAQSGDSVWMVFGGVYLLALLLPTFLLGWPVGLVVFVLFLLLALLLAMLVQKELEQVSLAPEGICVTSGGKNIRQIPASQIRTVAQIRIRAPKNSGVYLVVAAQTIPDLAGREEEYLGRTRYRRQKLAQYRQLPNWQAHFAIRYLSRQVYRWEYWNRDLLVLYHTPAREAHLREMYPDAQWLHTSETHPLL